MELWIRRTRPLTPIFVIIVMIVQIVTHLAWLPISTQVGQLGIPYLLSRGMTLFGDVIENRPPLLAGILAQLFRLLPSIEPILIVRMLNLLLVLALSVLIYQTARRLSHSVLAGICALLFWFLWEPVYGNILFYFDTLVGALFILTVFVWLVSEKRTPGWLAPFVCGLLLGGATVFKQPAWAGVILFMLWLIFASRRKQHLPIFLLGVAVLPLSAVLVFALQGNLDTYLFWNFRRYFGGIPSGQSLTGNTLRKFLLTNLLAPSFFLLAFRQVQVRLWLLVGVLWLAGGATMLPNFSEIYVMGHLPLLSVMSGILIASLLNVASLRAPFQWLSQASITSVVLAGLALSVAFGWGWTIAATYAPPPLGRARIPAYDEFKLLAARLLILSQPTDTLFVIPMADGNPQLYPLTGMLPAGMFINSHNVFLDVPGVTDKLLEEWAVRPPNIIVDFPELHAQFEPGVTPLVNFLQAHYHAVDQVDAVPFNGDAVIYRLNESP